MRCDSPIFLIARASVDLRKMAIESLAFYYTKSSYSQFLTQELLFAQIPRESFKLYILSVFLAKLPMEYPSLRILLFNSQPPKAWNNYSYFLEKHTS